MQSEIFRTYTGDQIKEIPEDSYTPLINNILYKNDMVGVLGKYKSNKSILAMQMACAISSGKPFLKIYNVPQSHNVWYFSTEGKDNELKDRFLRMSKIIPVNFDKLVLICSTQLKFNSKTGWDSVEKVLERHRDKLPGAIFIDSMYSGFKGTLVSDEHMNDFLTRVRFLAEKCDNAACVITHHFNKEQKDKDGNIMKQTTTNAYGSVFFMGQADHCFTIERCHKDQQKERIIKCSTEDQRSGNIVERIRVVFHEPDPLYLDRINIHKEEEEKITKILRIASEGLYTSELINRSKITKSLVYDVVNEMIESGKAHKLGNYNGKIVLSEGY